MGEKIIIDTDIGSDVDDAIAIAYGVATNLEIILITTVHGDAQLRAKIAKKLTMQLGVDIPTAAGVSKPIKQKYLYLTGREGKDYVNEEETLAINENGIDALIETIYTHKNNVSIAALGPLTNIALAIEKDPKIITYVNHIYMMGNALLRQDEYILNYRCHNFKVDPEAVDIVFASAIPKTIITTEIGKRQGLTREQLHLLAESTQPALQYLGKSAKDWLDFIEHEKAYLYDPLVIQHCIDPTLTTKRYYGKDAVTIDVKEGFDKLVFETLSKFGNKV